MDRTSILLADDQVLFVESLRLVFQTDADDLQIVATAENGVQPVPEHYTQEAEINHQNLLGRIGGSLLTALLTLITLGLFSLFALQRQRLMRK